MADGTSHLRRLGEGSPGEVGLKFHNLGRIADLVEVPDAVCVTGAAFAAALTERGRRELAEVLGRLQVDQGRGLRDAAAGAARVLVDLALPAAIAEEVGRVADELSDGWHDPLIVRSSTLLEDGTSGSGAGVFDSVAGVTGRTALAAAMLHCWRGAYSPAGMAHRLRTGAFGLTPLPALIMQRYVPAMVSGVCFSSHPAAGVNGIFVEYSSAGVGGVESGEGAARSFVVARRPSDGAVLPSSTGLASEIVDQLAGAVPVIRDRFGTDVDIEWCHHGGTLFILQVRPVRVRSATVPPVPLGPETVVLDLYEQPDMISRYQLGDVAGIYRHSASERRPVRLLAFQHRVATNGSALVINYHKGIRGPAPSRHPALNRLGAQRLAIDAGPYLRALLVDRADLDEMLGSLAGPRAFIVREYVSGEHAAVTAMNGGTVLVEVGRGPLISLNRGFADTATLLVDPATGVVDPDGLAGSPYRIDSSAAALLFDDAGTSAVVVPLPALAAMAEFTRTVHDALGSNAIEWAVAGGRPVYLDHTPTGRQSLPEQTGGVRFISGRSLRGTAIRVDASARLRALSSGPTLALNDQALAVERDEMVMRLLDLAARRDDVVIVAERPYTAFSPLIGRVRGFICECGPTLCHLAILAREFHTPIAVVANALAHYSDGDTIDLAV